MRATRASAPHHRSRKVTKWRRALRDWRIVLRRLSSLHATRPIEGKKGHKPPIRGEQRTGRARFARDQRAHAFPAFRVNDGGGGGGGGGSILAPAGKKAAPPLSLSSSLTILLIYSENYMQLPPPPSARRHLRVGGRARRRSRDRRASERAERARSRGIG